MLRYFALHIMAIGKWSTICIKFNNMHQVQQVFDKWCGVEDYSRSSHMGREGEIVRVVSPSHVKDAKTNSSVFRMI